MRRAVFFFFSKGHADECTSSMRVETLNTFCIIFFFIFISAWLCDAAAAPNTDEPMTWLTRRSLTTNLSCLPVSPTVHLETPRFIDNTQTAVVNAVASHHKYIRQ